ncbi:MAG: TonB-dependent receptor, partial [Chitinophagaceae bacterium]|nr:TonB-dependent receptor [Chitinophagaceae bacterium]
SYNSVRVGNMTIPYLSFLDATGSPIAVATDYRTDYTDTVGQGRLLSWNYYPGIDYKFVKDKITKEDLIASFAVTAKIIRGLNLSVNFQYQKQNSTQNKLFGEESYYARNLVNRFAQLGKTDLTDTFRVPKGGVQLNTISRELSQNGRAQLSYDRTWNGIVTSISTLAGMELRNIVTNGSNYSIYGYHDDPEGSIPVDYNTFYRTSITRSLAQIPNPPKINPVNTNRYVSLYWNVAMSFYNRFSINSSLRRDAANIFGLKTNDKWNPFWSSGVGWEISKEKFFSKNLFSYLKLKATLGTSGIVNPNKTADAIVSYSDDETTGYLKGSISSINNPNLKWEKSKQVNVGADFIYKNNRITGSIEYYIKKGKDLYGPAPFNYTAWGGSNIVEMNVANMQSSGIDATFNFVIIDRALKYNTTVIFNLNKTKTTQYFGPGSEVLSRLLSDGNMITPVVGKPLYAIAAYKWGGLDDKGDPRGYLNGQLSTDYNAIRNEANTKGINGNIIYIGPANPVVYGAWNHSVRWKGLELSCNLLYKLGYYFRKTSLNYQSLYFSGTGHSEYAMRWRQPGDEHSTNVPAMVYTNYPQFIARNTFYQSSEIQVLPGDHMRLQYINLAYTRNFHGVFVKDATISFNAANLGIIWRKNKYAIDPDFDYTSTVPVKPQFTFGIRTGF